MSLLLDALKKAAEAKSRTDSAPSADDMRISEAPPPPPPAPAPERPHNAPPGRYAETFDPEDEFDATHSDTIGHRFSAYDEFDETQQLVGDFGERTSDVYGSQKHAETVFTSKSVEKPLRKRLPLGKVTITVLLLVTCGLASYLYLQSRDSELSRELSNISARAPIVPLPLGEESTEETPVLEDGAVSNQDTDQKSAVSGEENALSEVDESTTTQEIQNDASSNVESGNPDNLLNAEAEQISAGSADTDATEIDERPAETAEVKSEESALAAQQEVESLTESVETSESNAADESLSSESTSEKAAVEAKPQTPNAGLNITQSVDENQADNLVRDAYAAYQAGDFNQSKALYDDALRAEPAHRDAMLGRAAIHLRQNESREALAIYQQLLVHNPRDHGAMAGLNSLASEDNLTRYESDLRFLLKDNPQSAPLNYALGVVLSRQKRWSGAQQQFFNAFSRDAENPDIAFNLAVSLDNLGKTDTAVDYYRTALRLAQTRAANFDSESVQRRLQALEQ